MDVIGQVYDRLLGGSVIVLAVLIILSIKMCIRDSPIADQGCMEEIEYRAYEGGMVECRKAGT